MLQQEKNIRTQVEALIKEKARRMQQLKALLEQDQDLCDVLCSVPYGIAPDSVPSLETLDNFHQHIANQNEERVGPHNSNHTSNRTLMWLHEEKLWDEHCYKQERCHWTGWDQSGCSTVWWAGFVSSSFCYVTFWLLHVSRWSDTLSSRSSKSRSFYTWRSWTVSPKPALRRTWSVRMRTLFASLETTLHHSNCFFARWAESFSFFA